LPTYLFGTVANNAGANLNLAGSSYVFGNVTNAATANIHLSGLTNVFYGTVANSGNLNVDQGASGLFYGAYSGNGPIVNNGFLYIDAGSVAGQVSGGGTLTLGAAGVPATLQLLSLGQTNIQSGLSINPGSTLDITNNTLNLTYGSGTDPAATIRAELISGYNAGGAKWTGMGITSSLAAANPTSFSVGYADGGNPIDRANTGIPAGTVEIKYTVAGDANLSGDVDLSDLVIIASDFGMTGADWAEGDVNYDGNVDLSDLVIVASNFGASLGSVQASDFSGSFAAEWQLALAEVHGAVVSVPEPASAGVLALAGLGVLDRRRRNMN
jgi:hypothetical protein